MGNRNDNSSAALAPRNKAAFDFLEHTRESRSQWDAAIPARDLTPLEKCVETAALRALQQYLLGEMDFVEAPPPEAKTAKKDGEDGGGAPAPKGCKP